MSLSAYDHGQIVLAGILPDRLDLWERADRHLVPEHFGDPQLRNLWHMVAGYYEQTGAMLTLNSVGDIMRQHDAGSVALYQELWEACAQREVTDAEFAWSLMQVRELAAHRATATALTQAMEILTQGTTDDDGETHRGHAEARTHVLTSFAEIDTELSRQEAPEGDLRDEGAEMLAEFLAEPDESSRGFEFGVPALDELLGGLQPGELDLLVGYTSSGKSQPLDACVLTPDRGFIPMRDIRIGDAVVDPEGCPSQVLGIYPQGVLPVYRVTFSDGSSAEASADHLWDIRHWKPIRETQTRPGVRGTQKHVRVRETWTTEQLRSRVLGKSRNPALVETSALIHVDFPERELPIDPYLLGLLLGDGGLTSASPIFTTPDEELRAACAAALPPGVAVVLAQVGSGCCSYRLSTGRPGSPNPLTVALRELGLMGANSAAKFVPQCYKLASAATRLAVLQGLMDTDGNWAQSKVEFSSASEQLRNDVVWLARSLGLIAHTGVKEDTWYAYRGERLRERPSYRARIQETAEIRVFRLARKLKALPPKDGGRRVVAVDYVRDTTCQCIRVSAPSALYVTDDFIPTHNTSLLVQLAWNVAVNQGRNVVIATTETLRPQVRRKLVCRHSKLPLFGLPEGIDSQRLKHRTLTPAEKLVLPDIVNDLTRNPTYGHCYIMQVPRGGTLAQTEARLLRVQRKWPIDVLGVDYFQLYNDERRRSSLREELVSIVKGAKQLAVTFDDGRGLCVVSPWQINRDGRDRASRQGHYLLDDLSETAESANSADVIISLLEPDDTSGRYVELLAQILKHRDGVRTGAGTIDLQVDYATCTFTSPTQYSALGGLAQPAPRLTDPMHLLGPV